MTGGLFVVSAPSGAGKTTLVRGLLANDPEVKLSISYTTRPARAGEEDGRDYYFVSRERFQEMANRGDFLESAEVYGNFYGTSHQWVRDQMATGQDILLEIDTQGAAQVRKLFPNCIGIFVLPPSLGVLETRLRERGKDSPEIISRRLEAAREEMRHLGEFDYVILNKDLDEALADLASVVRAERLRLGRQASRHGELFNQLR